jgi:hypothetical protein
MNALTNQIQKMPSKVGHLQKFRLSFLNDPSNAGFFSCQSELEYVGASDTIIIYFQFMSVIDVTIATAFLPLLVCAAYVSETTSRNSLKCTKRNLSAYVLIAVSMIFKNTD